MRGLLSNLTISIKLDFQLLFQTKSLKFISKLSFIFNKYLTLLNHYLLRPKDILFNWHKRDFFLDNVLSIGTLQSTFIDNDFLSKYFNQNSIIIDIGANIGQFRLFCYTVIGSKNIYSFEPIGNTYNFLHRNFDENTYKNAVATKHDLLFQIYDLSVWSSAIIEENRADAKTEHVMGIKPDEIAAINELPKIDLLKIDVEGAEADALIASESILQKSKYLIIETFLAKTKLTNLKQIIDIVIKNCPDARILKIGKIYRDEINEDAVLDIFFKLK